MIKAIQPNKKGQIELLNYTHVHKLQHQMELSTTAE